MESINFNLDVSTKLIRRLQDKYGILQGSVLGPILFMLHINEKYYAGFNVYINLYIYDTSIIRSDKYNDSLQFNCSKINQSLNVQFSIMYGEKLIFDF